MLEEKVLNEIKKNNLIQNGEKVVVGVSGGPDSLCLVNILNEIRNNSKYNLNFEIIVCHINHMIREEAKDDEEFVKGYCDKKHIPFFVKHAKVQEIAKSKKIGTEEAGRNIRYEFFKEVLESQSASKIATAHTKNDNAETVLMNIIRGSGLTGLKGIEPIRENIYIRPLIDVQRDEIELYCLEKGLNPRHDKTNDENIYTRNKIRNLLLPQIKEEFNPNIIETVDRLSKLVRKENDFLERITKDAFENLLVREEKNEIILNLKKFNKQDDVIKSRIIIYTIKRLKGDINGLSKVHIDDIIKLCVNNIGNKYLTPNKNIKVSVNKGKLSIFVTQNSQLN